MPRRQPEHSNQIPAEVFVSDLLKVRPFEVSETSQIINNFSRIAKIGLQSPIQEGPGPLMLRSHISPPEIPLTELAGKSAIGIDIGGTNLRMSVGKINKNGLIRPIGKIKSKEISIKYDSLEDFFEMLLKNGLVKLLKDNPDIPLACIFSFPGTGQSSPNGIDINIANDDMPKGWHIGGSKGKNLGEELNKFLHEQRKYFIANDTVALIQNQNDDFGVVCASGYNWSMIIEKSKLGESQGQPGKTIINTEAGQAAVAPTIPIITDKLLEIIAKEEEKPVDQVTLRDEYQVSGKYLGRTLGLVVDELRNRYDLFTSVKNTIFPKSFVVSNILTAGKTGDWKKVKKNFQIHHDFSDQEKTLLIQIASALRNRSAQIVADHLIALWQTGCPEKDSLIISSDGPIIQHMPGWKEKFMEEVNFVANRKLKIEIRETSYQGKMRDFRGIFDVMSQAIEYFHRQQPTTL